MNFVTETVQEAHKFNIIHRLVVVDDYFHVSKLSLQPGRILHRLFLQAVTYFGETFH